MLLNTSSIKSSTWSTGKTGGFAARKGLMKSDSIRSRSKRYCFSLVMSLCMTLLRIRVRLQLGDGLSQADVLLPSDFAQW